MCFFFLAYRIRLSGNLSVCHSNIVGILVVVGVYISLLVCVGAHASVYMHIPLSMCIHVVCMYANFMRNYTFNSYNFPMHFLLTRNMKTKEHFVLFFGKKITMVAAMYHN